jgi:CHAD domain-containing protein
MKALKKYFNRRIKVINLLLGKPRLTYSPDTFHKIRLEIKKLKAFFDLIKFCSKDFKRKKTYKPFKHIFLQAGKVRDLHVEKMMMKKYFAINFLNEYRSKLRNQRLKEQRNYFSVVNTKLSRLRKSCTLTIPYVKQLDEKKVIRSLDKKRKRIELIMKQHPLQPSHLHSLRKRLKHLNYIQKCLKIGKSKEPRPVFDALDKLLGRWHDCQVFIRHLELASNDAEVNQGERNRLEEIRTHVASDSKLLYDKLNEIISKTELYVNKSDISI